jgi:hypothetical protein
MRRHALGSFEDRDDGSWVCTKDTAVNGPVGSVKVACGQSFKPGTVFAGYEDFTVYLASISTSGGGEARHER